MHTTSPGVSSSSVGGSDGGSGGERWENVF